MSSSLLDSPVFGSAFADLLQANDQLEHVQDTNFGAQRLQVDDAVPFGLVIAGSLSGMQVDCQLGYLLWWKVVQYITLLAPKLQLAVSIQQLRPWTKAFGRSLCVVIDELQYRGQLLFMVLNGRACQRPGAALGNSFSALLVSLRFLMRWASSATTMSHVFRTSDCALWPMSERRLS